MSGESPATGKEAAIPAPELGLTTAPGNHAGPQAETLPIPLAAVGFNPALKLNARQVAQAVRLGQAFLADTDATPTTTAPSPLPMDTTAKVPAAANHVRWLSAQELSDERFKALFGYAAFNAQQILRSQQEHQAQQAGR